MRRCMRLNAIAARATSIGPSEHAPNRLGRICAASCFRRRRPRHSGVLDLLTHEVQRVMTSASRWPTVMSMAALGLGVDIRTVGRVGSHISVAVTASLLVLIVTGRALICFVGRA